MRFIICAVLLCCSASIFAQNGNYFLSHFSPDDERFDNVCFKMIQDERGIMYFATKSGLWQFDGRNWDLLNGTGPVYTLQTNSSGEIFWGGYNGFGKIVIDEEGFHKSILLSTDGKAVFQSVNINNTIFLLSENGLHIVNDKNPKGATLKSNKATGAFTGLFELFDKVYINTEQSGTYYFDKNILVKTNFHTRYNSEISFTTPFQSESIVGTADNKIYLCSKNLKLTEINLQDAEYANAGVIVSACWVNKNLVALGTLRGGVIFINPYTGKTEQIINYNTGLPDNEVFTLMSDKHQNVWIAHDYGFTRVAPYMPLRSFSHYSGLEGNLLCAISYQQQEYVGTSLGLFKLEKENLYDNVVYYEDVQVDDRKKGKGKNADAEEKVTDNKVIVANAKPKQEEIKQPAKQDGKQLKPSTTETKKKGLFGFLKKKKPTSVVVAEEKTSEPEKVIVQDQEEDKESQPRFSLFKRKPIYKREKKTQRILRSSQYVYRRVHGIDAKVTQLIEVQGKLISAGLSGAYEVKGLESKSVLEEPVRFIFANKNVMLASTYENEIRSWSVINGSFQRSALLENLNDEISFIFAGARNELWLCALEKVYRVKLTAQDVKSIQSIRLPNIYFDDCVGMDLKGKTIVVNAGGFYSYDRIKNKMLKIDSLPKPKNYFAGANSLWYSTEHGWHTLASSAAQTNLQLLNLFQDLRFITADQQSDNLWLITGSNGLFKFYGEKINPYEAGYSLMLKSIRNGEHQITHQKVLRVDQLKSSLTIEIVQPDYIASQSTEYRYFLKGLNKDWSAWSSNNNVIDFPYLPAGDYKLLLQAKDLFGKVTAIELPTFYVQPPYWQRSWFYALEFALFAGLVLLSLRLSTKYIIVSRVLSLLTIILLIQFIQTVASTIFSANTPVLDFFIQVFIALLILPVEGLLRKLMLRSLDTGDIYKMIRYRKGIATLEKEKIGDNLEENLSK